MTRGREIDSKAALDHRLLDGQPGGHAFLVPPVEATGRWPILDETLPLAETRAALEWMQAGQHTGKIVVAVA